MILAEVSVNEPACDRFAASRVAVIAVLCGLLAACSTPPAHSATRAPLAHWLPGIVRLEWPDSYWDEEIAQQSMNRKSYEWASILDAKLFILYTKLKEHLDAPAQARLALEQARWIERREKTATKEGKKYEGGTMEPLEHNVTFGNLTQRRIKTLAARLAKYNPATEGAKP